MNLLQRCFCLVLVPLVACSGPHQALSNNGIEHIRISVPKGWKFYDSKAARGNLPFTLIPADDSRIPDEATTSISFYGSRNQIGYFPKGELPLDSLHHGDREVKLWFAETYLAKYILCEFPYRDGILFATLVDSSKSNAVFEARKAQFLNIVSTLAKSR